MLNVVDSQGREDHEEVAQVSLLLVTELGREHLHQDVEILVAALETRCQVADGRIKSLGDRDHLLGKLLGAGEGREHGDVLDVGDEPDGLLGPLDAAWPDHPHEAHRVPDVGHEEPELVQVGGDTVRHQTQLADPTIEFNSPENI